MSVVPCLPAHLCVSPQRPVAGPPRERVNIRSPLDLQHGPRGSKIEKTSSTSLNTYTTVKYICGDRVKRIHGQSRPKNPRSNALTRLPSTKTNKNAKGDPLRCFMGCSVLGCGAEPPQFWVLLIWLEPGISHVTWVHYDATMCLPCFVCSILPVLHFLRFDLCVL